MKIVISDDHSGAHTQDRIAWAKVLLSVGHKVIYWDTRVKSPFDLFQEHPDIDVFYGQLYNINRALLKCLINRKPRVVLRSGNWGEATDNLDLQKYPILIASDQDKETACVLRDNSCLNFLHVHYHQNRIEETMGHWMKNCGIKVIGLPNAADTFRYLGAQSKKEFESDISIVSGYWPYKAQNLNKYIFPLCRPVGKYNIKIYGKQNWPVGQYLGPVHEDNEKHVYASTKVNIDVGEPHGEDLGFDQTERLFKVACAGGFYLHGGYIKTTHEDFFGGETSVGRTTLVVHAENPKEFEQDIQDYLSPGFEESRRYLAKNLQKEVLKNHTYWNRVATFFTELGLTEESEKVLKKKEEIVKCVL